MIVSASRRTDIPCWYTPWLMERLRAGYVLTRNPMNAGQISRVTLTPDVVDCIVFWSKDPAPLLAQLDAIDRMGYLYYFQFTLTPYGRDLERVLRSKAEIAETFIALSKHVGRERIVWRYDPVILHDHYTLNWHKEQFHHLCQRLSAYTDTVTISFVDLYSKLRVPGLREAAPEEMTELAAFFGGTARKFGLRCTACAEAGDFSAQGVSRASCIDKERIERICGGPLHILRDKNQRPGCGCCQSIDIGAYHTCPNGCVYCYANSSLETARRHYAAHDPKGEMLFGTVPKDAVILRREAKSCRIQQTRLDI